MYSFQIDRLLPVIDELRQPKTGQDKRHQRRYHDDDGFFHDGVPPFSRLRLLVFLPGNQLVQFLNDLLVLLVPRGFGLFQLPDPVVQLFVCAAGLLPIIGDLLFQDLRLSQSQTLTTGIQNAFLAQRHHLQSLYVGRSPPSTAYRIQSNTGINTRHNAHQTAKNCGQTWPQRLPGKWE